MTNPYRSEVTFTLAGQTWTARPTFEVMATIEHRCKRPIMEILQRVSTSNVIGVTELVTILQIILAKCPGAPKPHEIARIVMEDGIMSHVEPVVTFLSHALTGGRAGDDMDAGETSEGNA